MEKIIIRDLLTMWGEWAREMPNLGVGNLRMFDDGTGRGDCGKMSDETAAFFDPCVAILQNYHPEAYQVILGRYIYRGSERELAEHFGIARGKVRDLMLIGEQFIQGYYMGKLAVMEA